ncbi:metallophosphoesterase family protein [Chondromyces crocatus]|uniref:Hydrolase n=1 Tax=Chondromyces crocatus TaxID=52 RepID=A0A0K1EGM3_CHOCO|nr:DNA repair exonuclease [Chondromyces crocatus]AKT39999.1 hydrolase [Chondromyces crocatus]
MATATRFIHTADWQLGLRAHFIHGDAGALVREARLRTVARIGALAREYKADFVVVAGDVFEHHELKPDTLRRAFDRMADIPTPVYLLPGNHDPLMPGSLYESDRWRKECPPNVHVLASRDPIVVSEGVVILPCPLFEKHALGDVTDHLSPQLGPPDHVRIGVAHGGIREILAGFHGDDEPQHNTIPADLADRAQLDYLALGDWHGRLQIDDRTWYSGTPEATRFKERDPGSVLLVDIGARGEAPEVTPHEVCTFRWKQHQHTLDGADDLERLDRFLTEYPDKDSTLLELTLVGVLHVDLRARLDAEILSRASHRFRFLRTRDDGLHTLVSDDDLAGLRGAGWIGGVAERLRTGIEGFPQEDAERALRLLYRLHKEVA